MGEKAGSVQACGKVLGAKRAPHFLSWGRSPQCVTHALSLHPGCFPPSAAGPPLCLASSVCWFDHPFGPQMADSLVPGGSVPPW